MMFIAVTVILSGATGVKIPRWVPNDLAGYRLGFGTEGSQLYVQDQRSGARLIRTIECDGGHVYLQLSREKVTPDSLLQTVGSVKPTSTNFRYLGTGVGLRLGMSSRQIIKTFGAPKMRRGSPSSQHIEYFFRNIKNGEGYELTQTLTFKMDRLETIEIAREAVPGC